MESSIFPRCADDVCSVATMPTIDCTVEDLNQRFQVELLETPRMGEYIVRAGKTYVVASVTWELSRKFPGPRLILRELPPPP
jgi:hypothetical protein